MKKIIALTLCACALALISSASSKVIEVPEAAAWMMIAGGGVAAGGPDVYYYTGALSAGDFTGYGSSYGSGEDVGAKITITTGGDISKVRFFFYDGSQTTSNFEVRLYRANNDLIGCYQEDCTKAQWNDITVFPVVSVSDSEVISVVIAIEDGDTFYYGSPDSGTLWYGYEWLHNGACSGTFGLSEEVWDEFPAFGLYVD